MNNLYWIKKRKSSEVYNKKTTNTNTQRDREIERKKKKGIENKNSTQRYHRFIFCMIIIIFICLFVLPLWNKKNNTKIKRNNEMNRSDVKDAYNSWNKKERFNEITWLLSATIYVWMNLSRKRNIFSLR